MAEMVQIRSVKQFFRDFIVKPYQENGEAWLRKVSNQTRIKNQLLDAFRKEIFGQVTLKLGPEAATMTRDQMANLDGVKNILHQSFRKWKRLCILCAETGIPLIQLEDLAQALTDEDSETVMPNPEEDVTDKLDEILPPGEEPVYLETQDEWITPKDENKTLVDTVLEHIQTKEAPDEGVCQANSEATA